MPKVLGFASDALLQIHFSKHNPWDFKVKDEQEYLALAKTFFDEDLSVRLTEECVDGAGDIIRFNPITHEFGVVEPPNTIRTYYRAMPRAYAPRGYPLSKTHTFTSNRAYFEENCR